MWECTFIHSEYMYEATPLSSHRQRGPPDKNHLSTATCCSSCLMAITLKPPSCCFYFPDNFIFSFSIKPASRPLEEGGGGMLHPCMRDCNCNSSIMDCLCLLMILASLTVFPWGVFFCKLKAIKLQFWQSTTAICRPNWAQLKKDRGKKKKKHFGIRLHFHVVCDQELLLYFSQHLLVKNNNSASSSIQTQRAIFTFSFMWKCKKVFPWHTCDTLRYSYIWKTTSCERQKL